MSVNKMRETSVSVTTWENEDLISTWIGCGETQPLNLDGPGSAASMLQQYKNESTSLDQYCMK